MQNVAYQQTVIQNYLFFSTISAPPPLGGIAYGFDRFVAEILQKKNIREVIAFPKTLRAICPLTGAPDKVTDEQLEELNIDIKKK